MFDTISAVSTPFGRGGVALIRISGKEAFEVAGRVFRPHNGKKIEELRANSVTYGSIYKDGREIDDGLLLLFRGPHSYTGEDSVEITCHGGILLSTKVYESTLEAGARPAEGGEFTKRAFMNGKLSLTEAEGVIDLINAESEEQIKIAGSHRKGVLSTEISKLYDRLTALLAETYVFIDYPDEDLMDVSPKELKDGITEVMHHLEELLSGYKRGKAVMQGIKTAIVGKPNTGKSSLLNALLGRKRAIVSPIAGTTRDTVEETVNAGRVTLHLCDTAGIRDTADEIEKEGVSRSLEKIEEAELILAVFDSSTPLDTEDFSLIARLKEAKNQGKQVLVLLNKSDLAEKIDKKEVEEFPCFRSAAIEGKAPKELLDTIEQLYIEGDLDYEEKAILSNARQCAAVKKTLSHLENAVEALNLGQTVDIAALDVEEALSSLGELDGRAVGEDVVSAIFSRFCVGK